MLIAGSGVRCVWLRHTLEHFKKRLKALEEEIAKEGIILSDAQIAALEKQDDEACGEIDTAHPGDLGHLKGVGRLYPQTFVDTYSKIAFADLLFDEVLPFFEKHALPMLRSLTDRGTEYCGRVEHHDDP